MIDSIMKLFLAILVAFCLLTTNARSEIYDTPSAINAFGFKMYQEIVVVSEGPIFYSPLSVYMALALVSGGAATTTAQAFDVVLGKYGPSQQFHANIKNFAADLIPAATVLSSLPGNKVYELKMANGLWAGEKLPFKPSFVAFAHNLYQAEARNTSDNAAINAWISEKTDGKIKEMIQQKLDPNASVITNVIYFKGEWERAFDEHNTTPQPFHGFTGPASEVELMTQTTSMDYYTDNKASAIRLPYNGDRLVFVAVMPNDRGRAAFKGLEQSLDAAQWEKINEKMVPREVNLFLPRFEKGHPLKLNEPLKKIGLSIAFIDVEADFTNAFKNRAYISDVLHHAYIKLNEQGAEAVATTTIIQAQHVIAVNKPTVFRADRPFLYFIADRKTGTILFMGRFMG